ncbi:MAG TPA: ACT domain-containing protein, partial [Actinomycetota bacterium]|nr:ACT domain-containing protein [Actinomycetota bacterium]
PHDEARVRYYVVLSVVDRPGVLAAVAGAFAKEHISIASVRQEGLGDAATLALITHTATEGQHRRCFALLEHLDEVQSVSSTIRVEGTGES